MYVPFHNKTISDEILSAYLGSNIRCNREVILDFFFFFYYLCHNQEFLNERMGNISESCLWLTCCFLSMVVWHRLLVILLYLIFRLLDPNQITSSTNSQWNNILDGLLLGVLHYTASFMGEKAAQHKFLTVGRDQTYYFVWYQTYCFLKFIWLLRSLALKM